MMRCPRCGYKLRSTMKRRKPKYKRVGEHEYLIDARDKVNRRIEAYRAAGGDAVIFDDESGMQVEDLQTAYCQGCAETHPVSWAEGEMHHACTRRKKCDSLKCLLWICPTIHRLTSKSIHRRNPEWSVKND